MSLKKDALQSALILVFTSMTSILDGRGDEKFAREVSSAVADFIESGQIDTNDKGTISLGEFTGTGVGDVKVKSSICYDIIIAACRKMAVDVVSATNLYLAQEIARGIDKMTLDGEVNTDVKGTVKGPLGNQSYQGKAKGAFSVTGKETLQDTLYGIFMSMNNMTNGGDVYFAVQMTNAVDTYITNAKVETQGQQGLLGSIGNGAIS